MACPTTSARAVPADHFVIEHCGSRYGATVPGMIKPTHNFRNLQSTQSQQPLKGEFTRAVCQPIRRRKRFHGRARPGHRYSSAVLQTSHDHDCMVRREKRGWQPFAVTEAKSTGRHSVQILETPAVTTDAGNRRSLQRFGPTHRIRFGWWHCSRRWRTPAQ